MKNYKFPSRETFKKLLYAAYNISNAEHGVMPETRRGRNLTDAALETTDLLYNLLEKKTVGSTQGIILAIRLLVETTCSTDPQEYAENEIKRGHHGSRHEDQGAAISLPIPVTLKKCQLPHG